MTRSSSLSRVLFALGCLAAVVTVGAGCSADAADLCLGASCNAHPRGPAHGKRADGRIDVDAITAWPDRGVEPTPLTAQEIARACALAGACEAQSEKAPGKHPGGEGVAGILTALCGGPDPTEERAVPTSRRNERWSWWVRAVLAAGPSCDAIGSLHTDRSPSITCEEDGCWWDGVLRPAVSCAGTVATLRVGDQSWTRDCARAYARCDASSETGCTDRHPLACDPTAMDRCDGEVKLGCDGAGVVSFHDCSLVHQQCTQTAGGAACVPFEAPRCEWNDQVCDGTKLAMCVYGGKVSVDCADFGATCTGGHCELAAGR